MKSQVCWLVMGAALALPSVVLANRGGTDIVVPVPAEVWSSGSAARERNNNCLRCCVYENRNYSEGAVLKVDGAILQCVRDKQTVGTNDLIWQPLKQ
ncbi:MULTISPECIES: DUF1496 domain-containing protein [unclassified Brenneria]|uniref:DUF1496 domain-containing protein n=1 Tax=unclassified Brenneria TaxID=2634434 RepID=UPI0029C308B7|nr:MULTISPECIES: DUF1496 domain-containing protein [unclassified Brenneria]MDX5626797.1 DUF1496 domain-containing protein [Brenneria sp. L3-3Z]MDX5693853.1 DUF1496 domain-containing protein [Brenneria sp. L4-2C]MEE3661506.1 DUF1496 domain-containing protein [Brenneria sp. g21c3]